MPCRTWGRQSLTDFRGHGESRPGAPRGRSPAGARERIRDRPRPGQPDCAGVRAAVMTGRWPLRRLWGSESFAAPGQAAQAACAADRNGKCLSGSRSAVSVFMGRRVFFCICCRGKPERAQCSPQGPDGGSGHTGQRLLASRTIFDGRHVWKKAAQECRRNRE